MTTVYLNDEDRTYLDLSSVDVIDNLWLYGRTDVGNKIRIPISSILYVEEDEDEQRS